MEERNQYPVGYRLGDKHVINGKTYRVVGVRKEKFDSSYGIIAHNEGEVPSWVEDRKPPEEYHLETTIVEKEDNGSNPLLIAVLKREK